MDCPHYVDNHAVHAIALDVFASFMLEIAKKEKQKVVDIMSQEGTCDKITGILMKHNVCGTIRDAKLAILPALLTEEILVYDVSADVPKLRLQGQNGDSSPAAEEVAES